VSERQDRVRAFLSYTKKYHIASACREVPEDLKQNLDRDGIQILKAVRQALRQSKFRGSCPQSRRCMALRKPSTACGVERKRNNTNDRVTTRPANPTQLGGRRAGPCRRVVLSGNTGPGRKLQRAHTHGVDEGKTPRAAKTSCVSGLLLARVEGLEATLTPRPLIPSVPVRPSENPPQTPSKDPQKTLLSGHMGPASAEDGRSFGHRHEWRRGKGAT